MSERVATSAPEPSGDDVVTESYHSTVTFFDGPGDSTVRPARESLRRSLGKWLRLMPPHDDPPATTDGGL